jgi:uncharacterized secreted protein with C-terminal beta-propeller domain
MRRLSTAVLGLVVLPTVVSCSTQESTSYLAAFNVFNGCSEFEGWMREQMLERVTPWGLDSGGFAVGVPEVMRDAVASEAGAGNSSSAGSDVSSDTNVQELGVDEGDLVDNDGRYLYSVVGGDLRSFDTLEDREIDRVGLPAGGDHHMILLSEGEGNGRIIVTSGVWDTAASTVVTVASVEGAKLDIIRTTHLEGALVETRATGGMGYVVLRQDPTTRLNFVYPVDGGKESNDKALEHNKNTIRDLAAQELLPRIFVDDPSTGRGAVESAISCDSVGVPEEYSGLGLTWVASIDARQDGVVQGQAGVVADVQEIYASSNSIYVATRRFENNPTAVAPIRPQASSTAIHKFVLDDEKVRYKSSGTVPGYIISSYSMSEYNGLLRVATTTESGGFGEEMMSGVHTLADADGKLTLISSLNGLGPGESIHGVRFHGDLGFVVTFRRIDPLYIVDLSDPVRPKLRGELKVPGYSTWLKPLGDGRLLAFGQAGTDTGSLTGVQWSLYSIRDLDRPELLQTREIGQWSEGVYDPLALTPLPAEGVLLAPAESWGNMPVVEPARGGAEGTSSNVEPDSADTVVSDVPVGNGSYVTITPLNEESLGKPVNIEIRGSARRVVVVGGRIVVVQADGVITVLGDDVLEKINDIG